MEDGTAFLELYCIARWVKGGSGPSLRFALFDASSGEALGSGDVGSEAMLRDVFDEVGRVLGYTLVHLDKREVPA
jgi:hypothetical protein